MRRSHSAILYRHGPRQRPGMGFSLLIDALLSDREFKLFGDPSRSFTFVDDVVEATIAAMERAPTGAIYNVGGGDEASSAMLSRFSSAFQDTAHGSVRPSARVATRAAPPPTSPASETTWAGRRQRRSRTAFVLSGHGRRVEPGASARVDMGPAPFR